LSLQTKTNRLPRPSYPRKDFERRCRLRFLLEFVMYGFHLAISVAIIVTASLASNLLAIVTVGRTRAGTGVLMRVPLGLRRSPRHMKRLVDTWVAGMLVRRERQAAASVSQRLHGRALPGASSSDARIMPGRRR
jgi:hypothetical protein